MRSHRRLGVVLASCVLAAIGCSAFSSDESAPATTDGGAPDVSAVDAATPTPDAEADAGKDATSPCPPGAFCDDFERESLIGSWELLYGGDAPDAGDAKISLDGTLAASGKRSLRSEPVGVGSRATLYRSVPAGTTRVAISFSLRVSMSSPTQVHVVTVEFEKDDEYAQLMLIGGQLQLLEQNRTPSDGGPEYYNPTNVEPAVPNTFQRYTLTVDRAKRTFSLTSGAGITERALESDLGAISRYGIGTTFTSGTALPHWIDDVVVMTQ